MVFVGGNNYGAAGTGLGREVLRRWSYEEQ